MLLLLCWWPRAHTLESQQSGCGQGSIGALHRAEPQRPIMAQETWGGKLGLGVTEVPCLFPASSSLYLCHSAGTPRTAWSPWTSGTRWSACKWKQWCEKGPDHLPQSQGRLPALSLHLCNESLLGNSPMWRKCWSFLLD